jgi:hypothetical protein
MAGLTLVPELSNPLYFIRDLLCVYCLLTVLKSQETLIGNKGHIYYKCALLVSFLLND